MYCWCHVPFDTLQPQKAEFLKTVGLNSKPSPNDGETAAVYGLRYYCYDLLGLKSRSIGYQSLSIADEEVIPFDFKTHTIPNAGGRVQNRPGKILLVWVSVPEDTRCIMPACIF